MSKNELKNISGSKPFKNLSFLWLVHVLAHQHSFLGYNSYLCTPKYQILIAKLQLWRSGSWFFPIVEEDFLCKNNLLFLPYCTIFFFPTFAYSSFISQQIFWISGTIYWILSHTLLFLHYVHRTLSTILWIILFLLFYIVALWKIKYFTMKYSKLCKSLKENKIRMSILFIFYLIKILSCTCYLYYVIIF